MKKNGQLRIAFSELVPPDGIEQQVVSTLEGVQAGKDANVKLDSEGGAEATTSKSRYLGTAVSLGLAMMAVSSGQDHDGDGGSHSGATGGLGGFKLVGMVVGAVARSRAFGTTMGVYGAAASVYSHFIARGHEVVFPKNTAMQIGIGTRAGTAGPRAESEARPATAEISTMLEFGRELAPAQKCNCDGQFLDDTDTLKRPVCKRAIFVILHGRTGPTAFPIHPHGMYTFSA